MLMFDFLPAELGIDLVPLKAGSLPICFKSSGPEPPDDDREWVNLLQKQLGSDLFSGCLGTWELVTWGLQHLD